jgi:hypothetical protein
MITILRLDPALFPEGLLDDSGLAVVEERA